MAYDSSNLNNMAQIDYTSRDFAALKTDLINLISSRTGKAWDTADPSDLGSVLVEAFAYMGDIMSYYIDRVANESSVETAVKRETLLNFAALYGYKPSGPTPATVNVLFTNTSAAPIDIPIGTQIMAPLTYGPYTEVYFETTQSATQLAASATITLTAKEGKTVNTDRPDLINPVNNKPLPASLGSSTGESSQEIIIPDFGLVDSSLIVYVGQGAAFAAWSYVDTLSEYGPTALVFTTSQNADGSLTVIFGDGVNGAVPPTGQLISASYKTSLGAAGNVISSAITEVTFIPGNIDPEAVSYLSVTNDTSAIGGADADSSDQLRTKIKSAISARRRAVTLEDYEFLANQTPQIGRAKAISSIYSSVTLYIQTQNDGTNTPGIAGGSPTSTWTTLQSNVQKYLSDKIPVGTTLTIVQPTYVPVYVSMNVVVGAAFKRNTVKLDIAKAFLNAGGLFSYESNTFGRTIALSSVISKAAGIAGVESITLTKLNTDNGSGVATITLAANQIPYLLPTALIITPDGGLL